MDKPYEENQSNPQISCEEFELLVLKFLDGVHTEDEARLLSEQLFSRADNRDLFAELSLQAGIMNEVFLAARNAGPEDMSLTENTLSAPLPSVSFSASSSSALESQPGHSNFLSGLPRVNGYGAIGGMLFSFLIGVVATYFLLRSENQSGSKGVTNENAVSSDAQKSDSHIAVAAHITSTMGCDWKADNSETWTVGEGIPVGTKMTLREGIAEFKLDSGVILNVEGPAVLILTSANSLVLRQGKLTVRVPGNTSDFRLSAGECEITTFDSDFGVYVIRDKINVHVFSGEVTAFPSPFVDDQKHYTDEFELGDEDEFMPTVIRRGNAVEFTSGSRTAIVSRRFAADQSQFVAKLSMAGRLPITDLYVESIKKANPVGYWRFESVENNKIRNEIVNGCPLRAPGELALVGDQSNHVLDLGETSKNGNMVSTGTETMDSLSKEDYSIELWFNPSHYHCGYLLALGQQVPIANSEVSQAQWREQNFFGLQLQPEYGKKLPGTIHCANRNPVGVYSQYCYSNTLYKLRRWQHVAVVKGKSGMLMYLDGKVVASDKGSKSILPGMHMVIGRSCRSIFPFFGQLDELAVYDRALTQEEVSNHYKIVHEAGVPKPGI